MMYKIGWKHKFFCKTIIREKIINFNVLELVTITYKRSGKDVWGSLLIFVLLLLLLLLFIHSVCMLYVLLYAYILYQLQLATQTSSKFRKIVHKFIIVSSGFKEVSVVF